ncbi:MAG: hypothetical protein EOM67_15260 [Spirochaetia bacterium]|nr:hypothetical protein [Spirochaetia bacterium]
MSEHFSFIELVDSKSHPELVSQNMVDAKGYEKQLKYTAGTLEEIRAILCVPMKITSGFRNSALNKAVGGSPTSGHTKGLCADFIHIGLDVDVAYDLIMMNKTRCPSLKKCIYESVKGAKWLHIETKTEANQPTQFFTTTNGKTYTEIKA